MPKTFTWDRVNVFDKYLHCPHVNDLHAIYIIIDIYTDNTCSNYELPFIGSKIYHLDACISIKYVHSSYVHILIHISHTHHIKLCSILIPIFFFKRIFFTKFKRGSSK